MRDINFCFESIENLEGTISFEDKKFTLREFVDLHPEFLDVLNADSEDIVTDITMFLQRVSLAEPQ